jgi:ATP-binding cassette subfamily C protein EexD
MVIVLMFLFHPWYGWMAVFAVMVLMTLAIVNEKVTQKMLSEANEEAAKARVLVNKNLRNAEVIEAMGDVEKYPTALAKRK